MSNEAVVCPFCYVTFLHTGLFFPYSEDFFWSSIVKTPDFHCHDSLELLTGLGWELGRLHSGYP